MKKSIKYLTNTGCVLCRYAGMALFIFTNVFLLAGSSQAQVSLSGTSYFQDFNDIGSGAPEGWSFLEGASSGETGVSVDLKTSPTTWSSTSSGFKNYASANGLSIDSSSSDQGDSLDRAVGVRSTGSFGDPGAAFMFSVADTLGFSDFGLSFDAQILDEEGRSTEWTVGYRIGDSEFVSMDSFTLSDFGTQNYSYSFGNSLDNLGDSLDFRIASLSDSIGSGSRDTFAIDNFEVSFTPVPEPEEYMLFSGVALIIFGLFRKYRTANPDLATKSTSS